VLPTNGDFIDRHAKAISLNHKVSVLHIVSDKTISKSKIENTETTNFNLYIGYIKSTKNPLLKIARFYKMYKLLLSKIEVFDIIHLNVLFPFGIFALHQKLFYKKPYIISEHWTDYKYPLSKKISLLEKNISKVITKNASFVCPVTKDLQNSMKYFGLKGNYLPVPNVVDTTMFTVLNQKKKSNFKILHVSNMLDTQKNISGILNVIKKLQNEISDFEFLLIGQNSNAYESKIKELKIDKERVSYLNHIPHNELVEHLNNASLFVLFSNHENLPCVILESFSAGTPVLSSNVGGIKEYFPKDFGKLIPPNDEYQLLETIKSFYNKEITIASPKKMHEYVVENFSKQHICNIFTDLYRTSLIQKNDT